MILINYWTNEHFEQNIWDKIYCNSFTSAKKELRRLLMDYTKEDKEIRKEVIKQFDIWRFDKKTMFSVWCANISVWYLHICIEKINLI